MRYLFTVFILLFSWVIFAQSEAELKKEADKYYKNKDYHSAKTNYLKLVSIQPRNVEYNFLYGVCLLKTTTVKSDAIKHLNYVVHSENPIVEAYFYLGEAYHLDYQFRRAIKNYEAYLEKGGKASSEFDVDNRIQMCKSGLGLFQDYAEIIVRSKKTYKESEFFRLYDEKKLNGSILVSTIDQTKIDKRNKHTPIIFYPKDADIIFFSSYGDKNKGDKDIYYKVKTKDGWGVTQLIMGDVNTEYDEDYPYFDAKTNTLYFSSKGHNSMGGYDIFSAKYNPSNNTFTNVKNLDFAISSTGNDLFYVPNENDGIAWFASDRDNEPGKLTVYEVEIERYPTKLAFVKGSFESKFDAISKQIKIELLNKRNNKKIGTYYTDEQGNYTIPIYYSGDYIYEVTIAGINKKFTLDFSIPKVSNLVQYGHKMIHKSHINEEIVELLILSDEEIATDNEEFLSFIRQKSELAVSDESAFNRKKSIEEYNALEREILKAQEILEEDLELEAKANQKIIDNVRVIKVLEDDLKKVIAQNDVATLSPAELRNANEKIARITSLENENQQLKKISDSLQRLNSVAKDDSETLEELASRLNNLPDEQKENLTQFKEENQEGIKTLYIVYGKRTVKKDAFEKYDELNQQKQSLETEKEETRATMRKLESEIVQLEEAQQTAKPKDKERINEEIRTKRRILSEKEEDIVYYDTKLKNINEEITPYKNEKDLYTAIHHKKVDKKYTHDEVVQALEEQRKSNFKPIKNLITQEYAKKEHFIADENNSSSSFREEKLTKAWTKYETIYTKNEVSPNEKKEAIREAKEELENEIKRIKAQPETSENKDYLAKLNQSLEALSNDERTIDKVVSDEKKEQKRILVETLIPSYYENIENINQTGYANDWEKVVALKKQEENLKQEVEKRVQKSKNNIDLIELETEIESSIQLYQDRLKQLGKEEVDKSRKQAAQLLSNVQQLAITTEETEFFTQSEALKRSLQEELTNVTNLQKALQKETISIEEHSVVIEELKETLMLLEAKESEHKQMLLAQTETEVQTQKENTYSDNQEIQAAYLSKEQLKTTIQSIDITQEEEFFDAQIATNEEVLRAELAKAEQLQAEMRTKNENTTEIDVIIAELGDLFDVLDEKETAFIKKSQPAEEPSIASIQEEEYEIIIDIAEDIRPKKEQDNSEKVAQENTQNLVSDAILTEKVLEENKVSTPEVIVEDTFKEPIEVQKTEEIPVLIVESLDTEIVETPIKKEKVSEKEESAFRKEISNEQVQKAIQENDALKAKIEVANADFSSSNFSKQETKQRLNKEEVTFEDIENEIYSDDFNHPGFETFSTNILTDLSSVSQSKNTYFKTLQQEELQFVYSEIDYAQQELNELPIPVLEERLNYLYQVEQGAQQKIKLLENSTDKLTKKERKDQEALIEALYKKERYVRNEKFEIEDVLKTKKTETSELARLQEEYIELEAIIIKGNTANAEQITLYNLLSDELKDLEKLYTQQTQLENAIYTANSTEKALLENQLKTNRSLQKELEKLTNENIQLLRQELENPSVSTAISNVSVANVTEEIAQVSFVFQPEEAVSADQIKLILESEDYPRGLFFRVQVGAFAKPINENVYRDFSPITMENLNKGLIKYMAGYFTEEAVAVTARDKIRQLGFKDAFIVAYCDGKRIPVYEARRLLAQGLCLPVSNKELLFHIAPDKQELLAKAAVVEENYRQSTQVATTVKDLYYTVQVGVFNRYVEASYLKGMTPINTDEAAPNVIRHSIGVFNNLDAAKEQRLEAINKGFKDAFIVAYHGGKRITVAEAKQRLENGTAQLIHQSESLVETITDRQKIETIVNKNYIEELKETIIENRGHRAISNDVSVSKEEKDTTYVFKVSQTTLSLEFYLWIIHNFEKYSFEKKEDSILVHVEMDETASKILLKDFEELHFSEVNIVK